MVILTVNNDIHGADRRPTVRIVRKDSIEHAFSRYRVPAAPIRGAGGRRGWPVMSPLGNQRFEAGHCNVITVRTRTEDEDSGLANLAMMARDAPHKMALKIICNPVAGFLITNWARRGSLPAPRASILAIVPSALLSRLRMNVRATSLLPLAKARTRCRRSRVLLTWSSCPKQRR